MSLNVPMFRFGKVVLFFQRRNGGTVDWELFYFDLILSHMLQPHTLQSVQFKSRHCHLSSLFSLHHNTTIATTTSLSSRIYNSETESWVESLRSSRANPIFHAAAAGER